MALLVNSIKHLKKNTKPFSLPPKLKREEHFQSHSVRPAAPKARQRHDKKTSDNHSLWIVMQTTSTKEQTKFTCMLKGLYPVTDWALFLEYTDGSVRNINHCKIMQNSNKMKESCTWSSRSTGKSIWQNSILFHYKSTPHTRKRKKHTQDNKGHKWKPSANIILYREDGIFPSQIRNEDTGLQNFIEHTIRISSQNN